MRLDRLRLSAGRPLAFDRTFLPLRYGRLLERETLATETVFTQLETRFAIPLLAGRYAIETVAAGREVAASFGVLAGTSLLRLHRTLLTADSTVVYYQRRDYPGDRVRFTLDVRRAETSAHAKIEPLPPTEADPEP